MNTTNITHLPFTHELVSLERKAIWIQQSILMQFLCDKVGSIANDPQKKEIAMKM
jgi:hypothetical protein